jgi:putative addiction module component (TIGR02574 family)
METLVMTFEELEAKALKLSAEERDKLVQSLILSLGEGSEPDPEHERLWREEIDRRCLEIDEGRAELIPAEEVFRSIRSELR